MPFPIHPHMLRHACVWASGELATIRARQTLAEPGRATLSPFSRRSRPKPFNGFRRANWSLRSEFEDAGHGLCRPAIIGLARAGEGADLLASRHAERYAADAR